MRNLSLALALGAALSACGTMRRTSSLPRTIPFEYYRDSFMIVPVQVNGQAEKFVFDTGIGINLVSKSLCRKLDCKTERSFSGKRMSGQEISIPMTTVKSLALGEATLENAPVGIFDMEASMPEMPASGFLSLGFFRDRPHTVDYQKRTITFEDESSLAKIRAEGVRVPIQRIDEEPPSFSIQMPLQLPSGRQITAELDTGSQSLILNEKFMKELGISPDGADVKQRKGKDETGHAYTRYFTKLHGPISLVPAADFAMEKPDVMFQKIQYDGLVGIRFMQQFRVTFDLSHSELIFRRP